MDDRRDFSHYVRGPENGLYTLELILADVDCAACFNDIEARALAIAGVEQARVNVTCGRLTVAWREGAAGASAIMDELARCGYATQPFQPQKAEAAEVARASHLLKCLAVASFAAMNIMLLSVSVWAGGAMDIDSETRDFFHWLSALIALPAAGYAGQPFFTSALKALGARRMNMDVPISLGILLALGMSVFETLAHREHAYFDSAIMLLVFLLFGRVLEQSVRRQTRVAAGNIAALKGSLAQRVLADGSLVSVPVASLAPGDEVLVRAGERVPADAIVVSGASSLDESVITGETRRRDVAVGAAIYAGSQNFDCVLRLRVSKAGVASLIDDVASLVEKAGEARSRYRRLADRAARLYAPMVHLSAALTLAGWLLAGSSLHDAMICAIAVLIITCPCALALAVPAVQVVAAGRLFRAGVFLNTPEALERLSEIDMVVFDKTGTLTQPRPQVVNRADVPVRLLAAAASLSRSSRHPLAAALAACTAGEILTQAREVSGAGVEALVEGELWRLGSAAFCEVAEGARAALHIRCGDACAPLVIDQMLRPDAIAIVARLRAEGFPVAILSGDHEAAVSAVAAQLGVTDWRAGLKPAQKIAAIEALKASGKRILMVGDGLNDAPALAAAHASMAPMSAIDMAQAQADAVFIGERLEPVAQAMAVARHAKRLMRENLALAVVYNVIAAPLAMAGHVTPLIAAAAMSGSSILVTLNALRACRGSHVAGAPESAAPPMIATARRLA
jgi:Cu2+-exporting ATPase